MIGYNKRETFLSIIKQCIKHAKDNTKIYKILEIQRELAEDDAMYTLLMNDVEIHNEFQKYWAMYLHAFNEYCNKFFNNNTTGKDLLNKVSDRLNEEGINNFNNVLYDVYGESLHNMVLDNTNNVLDNCINILLNVQKKN